MINSYIIMNRKTSSIIKFFITNIFILIFLVILGINTFYYQSFIQLHSKILYYKSDYYMEVLVPVKEVNKITTKNQLIINSKKYNYQIHKIDNNIIYTNQTNFQKIYLKIQDLNKSYKINGYEIDIKILTKKKKIIEYLRNEKEELYE